MSSLNRSEILDYISRNIYLYCTCLAFSLIGNHCSLLFAFATLLMIEYITFGTKYIYRLLISGCYLSFILHF